jgi:Uma2 family endonuclease
MGMPVLAPQWTAEMVRALPDDGKRYEVVDGELFVTPAPRWSHQHVLLELALRLTPYARAHNIGVVVTAPADIEYDPSTLVQPDLFVAPLIEGRVPISWQDVRSLRLVVEVLSDQYPPLTLDLPDLFLQALGEEV